MASIDTARLAARLGKLAGSLNEVNAYRGTTLVARVSTLEGQYTSVNPSLTSALYSQFSSAVSAMDGWVGYTKTFASAVLLAEVQNSRPLVQASQPAAVAEWRRQMLIAGDSFNACPATLVTATVAATGDPSIVTSGKDGSGQEQDLIIPDVYLIQCSQDKDNGSTKWAEQFTIRGKPADSAATNYDYPTGSGYSSTVNAIDPAGNFGIATDGSFTSWNGGSPNTLTAWAAGTGCTYGVQLIKATEDPRAASASASLELLGDGTAIPAVKQLLSGVRASATYAVNLRIKKVADPGTDWGITVRLVDGSGTLVGNAITSVTCGSLSANWLNALNGTIITPAVLPAAVYLEVRMHQFGAVGTAPVNTSQAYVSHLSVSASSPLYTGGPRVSVFSGTVASVVTDSYTVTVTITGTLSSYLIREIDRLVDLRSLSPLRLPSVDDTTETILDALVS